MLVLRSSRALVRLATLACLVTGAATLACFAGPGQAPEPGAASRGEGGGDIADVHPLMPSVDPEIPGGVEPGWGGQFSSCEFIRLCPGQSPCDPLPDGQPLNCDSCSYLTLEEKACRWKPSLTAFCQEASGWVVTCGPYWRGRCKTWQSPGNPPRHYCSYYNNPITECRRSMCVGSS